MEFRLWNQNSERKDSCPILPATLSCPSLLLSAGPCQRLQRWSLWQRDDILKVWTERWHTTVLQIRCSVIAWIAVSAVWVFTRGFQMCPKLLILCPGALLLFCPLGAHNHFYGRPWDCSGSSLCLELCVGLPGPCTAPTASQLSVCCGAAAGMSPTFPKLTMLLACSLGRLDCFSCLALLFHDKWFYFTWSL